MHARNARGSKEKSDRRAQGEYACPRDSLRAGSCAARRGKQGNCSRREGQSERGENPPSALELRVHEARDDENE